MVRERLGQHPSLRAAASSVATELGCSLSAVTEWFARARNEGWMEWLRRHNSGEGHAVIVALIAAQDERIERLEAQLERLARTSARWRAKERLSRLAKTRAQGRVKTLLTRLARERQERRKAESALKATVNGVVPHGNASAGRRRRRRQPSDIFQRLSRHLQRVSGNQAGPISPEQVASVVHGSSKDDSCWVWTGGVQPSLKARTTKSGLVRPGVPFIRVGLAPRQRVINRLHELRLDQELPRGIRIARCPNHSDCVNPNHRPLR